MTRAHVRLLGPCFKTGRVEDRPIRHWPEAFSHRTSPSYARGRESTDGAVHPSRDEQGWPEGGRETATLPRPSDELNEQAGL